MAVQTTNPEHIAAAKGLWGYSEAGNIALTGVSSLLRRSGVALGSIELAISRLAEARYDDSQVRIIVQYLVVGPARDRCLGLLPSVGLVLHELTFWRGYYTGQHEAYRTVLRDVEGLLAVDHAVATR